jgi:uncharacterized Zn ribbon protein
MMQKFMLMMFMMNLFLLTLIDAEAQVPVWCDCYGGIDSTGAYWNLLDHSGSPLQDGDLVYAAWTGPDGEIDPPAWNGHTTDDDQLVWPGCVSIEYGRFYLTVTVWPPDDYRHPVPGELIYCRIFDDRRVQISPNTYYGDSQLYEVQPSAFGQTFFCLFPGDPGGGHTDTPLCDRPVNDITIYGGLDTTGFSSWPLMDIHGQQLEDGDLVQLISAGANASIDSMAGTTGLPGGDDILLDTWGVGYGYGEVGTGLFQYTTYTFETDPWEGYLAQGDLFYLRVFDNGAIGEGSEAKRYGESSLHQVIYEPDEIFYSFPDSIFDAVNTAPWYRSLAVYGGFDSAMTEYPLTDAQGVLLDDGDLVQLIWAGTDGEADVINELDGLPTGDDSLLTSFPVGGATFQVELQIYGDPQWGRPALGDLVYFRIFDDSSTGLAGYYGESETHTVLYQQGERFFCFSDETVDAVHPLNTMMTIFGGFDSTMTEYPLTDALGTMLRDGDLAQVIWAGPDGMADVIDGVNGMPTGDDSVLTTVPIDEGTFQVGLQTFDNPQWGRPVLGDHMFIRVFDESSSAEAVFYGQSDGHAVSHQHGETFFCFSDETDDAVNPFYTTLTIYGGMDSSMVAHPLTDNSGVMLQDGDAVQLIWAGPDGIINPIGPYGGLPTEDDSILIRFCVGEGYRNGIFSVETRTYSSHQWGYPMNGDVLYLRVFNDSLAQKATHYGESVAYPVARQDGEIFHCFSDDADDTIIPNPSYNHMIGGSIWSTFLGGSKNDTGHSIAVDADGYVYIAGITRSSDFPTTSGVYDRSHNGELDIFLCKLNPAGTDLEFSTFLGGSEDDVCKDLAVQRIVDEFYIFMTGYTSSANFPTTPGVWDTDFDSGENQAAFVTRLEAEGGGLYYSTLLEGSENDGAIAVTIDDNGNAYMTGQTHSSDFPTTSGAYDESFLETDPRQCDMFLTKLNSEGTGLIFSTYFGGDHNDNGYGIELDVNKNIYIIGTTSSATGFPCTPGAFDSTYNGISDVFLAVFNPIGSELLYASYIGGIDCDIGRELAVDGIGSVYMTGRTSSTDFPTTYGAYDTTFRGCEYEMDTYYPDAFVSKLSIEWNANGPKGSSLIYSTFLASGDFDYCYHIDVDDHGNAFVSGYTGNWEIEGNSFWGDFPTTPWSFKADSSGSEDVFVAVINATGSELLYSSVFGGSGRDYAYDQAFLPPDTVLIVGKTESDNFPVTEGAFDTEQNGLLDAFVMKFCTEFFTTPVVTESPKPEIPQSSILHQNYPNPFNARTKLQYQVPEDAYVSLRIYNILGQEVITLVDRRQRAGDYIITWDGRDDGGLDVASGIYFCRLQVGGYAETVKMVILR